MLRMPNHRLTRRVTLYGVGVGWKKARSSQIKTRHQLMKSVTIGLSHVNRYKLPSWGPREVHNQWLETLGDG